MVYLQPEIFKMLIVLHFPNFKFARDLKDCPDECYRNYFSCDEFSFKTEVHLTPFLIALDKMQIPYMLFENRFFFSSSDFSFLKSAIAKILHVRSLRSAAKQRNRRMHALNGNIVDIASFEINFYDGRVYNGAGSFSVSEYLSFYGSSHFVHASRANRFCVQKDSIVFRKFFLSKKVLNRIAHALNGNIFIYSFSLCLLVGLVFLSFFISLLILFSLRSVFSLSAFSFDVGFRKIVLLGYEHFSSSFIFKIYCFFFLRREWYLYTALSSVSSQYVSSSESLNFCYKISSVHSGAGFLSVPLCLHASLVSYDLSDSLEEYFSDLLSLFYVSGNVSDYNASSVFA